MNTYHYQHCPLHQGPGTTELTPHHKSWNYYEDFCTFLQRKDRTVHLFLLKRCKIWHIVKIICNHVLSLGWLNVFLSTHEYTTNKITWLAVIAVTVIGVQLIGPDHEVIISNKSTNSSLKLFFENLYEELCNHQVDETLFGLTSPDFKLVSEKLLTEVQKEKPWTRCSKRSKRDGRISYEWLLKLCLHILGRFWDHREEIIMALET